MSTTKSETIIAAIKALADGTTGVVAGGVYRSREEALRREETPAIIIEKGQSVASYPVIGFIDWDMQFKATVYTRGLVPDQIADPIVADFYARIMADRNLGGLAFDVMPVGFYPNNSEGDQNVGVTELLFNCKFRTRDTDLTQ